MNTVEICGYISIKKVSDEKCQQNKCEQYLQYELLSIIARKDDQND